MARSPRRTGRPRASGNRSDRPAYDGGNDAQSVTARLNDASDRMVAGEREVARASRVRLKELLAELPGLSPADAWRRILDPDLVPEDRERLEQALVERTTPGTRRRAGGRARRIAWLPLLRPSRSVRRFLIALAPLGLSALAVLAIGWWRTPVPASFATEATVEWHRPDGVLQTVRHRVGSGTLVRRSTGPGTVLLAVVPGRHGFAVARVDPPVVGR